MMSLLLPLLASCGGSGGGPPATSGPDPAPPAPPPPGNDPPQAANDSASTPRGVSVVVHVLTNDTDPEGDELQLDSVGAPAHGTATAQSDGSVTYAPVAGFDGTDSFAYTISDGNGGMDTANVSITVMAASGDALRNRIAEAPEGSWLKVNANRYEEVWTPVSQRARVNDVAFGSPRKIITAWASMTWDSNRSQLIIWGGGHANYAGNEVLPLRCRRSALASRVAAKRRGCSRSTIGASSPWTAPRMRRFPRTPTTTRSFCRRLDRFITFGGASYNAGRLFVLDDGVTEDRTISVGSEPRRCKHGRRHGRIAGGLRTILRDRRPDVDQPQCDRRQWHRREAAGLIRQWHFGIRARTGRRVDPRD